MTEHESRYEIERKFLVRALPADLESYPRSAVMQGYMGSSQDGDTVRLIRPDGVVVDSTSYTSSAPDVSRSRAPDGSWYDSVDTTPAGPCRVPQPTRR